MLLTDIDASDLLNGNLLVRPHGGSGAARFVDLRHFRRMSSILLWCVEWEEESLAWRGSRIYISLALRLLDLQCFTLIFPLVGPPGCDTGSAVDSSVPYLYARSTQAFFSPKLNAGWCRGGARNRQPLAGETGRCIVPEQLQLPRLWTITTLGDDGARSCVPGGVLVIVSETMNKDQ